MRVLFCLALLSAAASAEVRVNTSFEGGNAQVVSLDEASRVLRIMPELHEGRGWPCWWYLQLTGLKAGEAWKLEVQAQSKPFRDAEVLSANWCQPKHPWLSADGADWKPGDAGTKDDSGVMTYRFTAPAEQIHLAWGPPFVPADAEKLVSEVAAALPEAEPFVLATTRGGRQVHGVRVGREDARHQVWVNARLHAWEAGGSQVGRGFIRWFISGEAKALREITCLHYVPLMDVDNAAIGAGGKESIPRDHNRDWSAEPTYPEIAAAQRMIRRIHERHGLDAYIDLHNPGASDPVFFFGPFAFERMEGIQRRNYQRWIELAAAHIQKPVPVQPKYRFATYVKSDEERTRMSSGWVRALNSPTTISLTLETGWNSPLMTVEGYGEIGAGLGRALAAYLATNPRE